MVDIQKKIGMFGRKPKEWQTFLFRFGVLYADRFGYVV